MEFTFEMGRWRHLGEATLVNRVKSHIDVGERWYPDILQKIREEQAIAAQKAEEKAISQKQEPEEDDKTRSGVGAVDVGRAIEAQ